MRGFRTLAVLSVLAVVLGVMAGPVGADHGDLHHPPVERAIAWPSSYFPTVVRVDFDHPVACDGVGRTTADAEVSFWFPEIEDEALIAANVRKGLGEPDGSTTGVALITHVRERYTKVVEPRVSGFVGDDLGLHGPLRTTDQWVVGCDGHKKSRFADEIWFVMDRGVILGNIGDIVEVRRPMTLADVDIAGSIAGGVATLTVSYDDPSSKTGRTTTTTTADVRRTASCSGVIFGFTIEIEGVNAGYVRVPRSIPVELTRDVKSKTCSSFSLNFEEIRGLLLPAVQ